MYIKDNCISLVALTPEIYYIHGDYWYFCGGEERTWLSLAFYSVNLFFLLLLSFSGKCRNILVVWTSQLCLMTLPHRANVQRGLPQLSSPNLWPYPGFFPFISFSTSSVFPKKLSLSTSYQDCVLYHFSPCSSGTLVLSSLYYICLFSFADFLLSINTYPALLYYPKKSLSLFFSLPRFFISPQPFVANRLSGISLLGLHFTSSGLLPVAFGVPVKAELSAGSRRWHCKKCFGLRGHRCWWLAGCLI